MKQFLLMIAVVALVGCGKKEAPKGEIRVKVQRVTPNPELPKAAVGKLIADPIVEKAIRKKMMGPPFFKKVTGELTEADLAKVTELSLNNTEITDAGLKELPKLQQLTTLNLSFTQITDASIKDLAKLKQLRNLYLSNTKITEAGVAELKKALPNCIIYHGL